MLACGTSNCKRYPVIFEVFKKNQQGGISRQANQNKRPEANTISFHLNEMKS